MFYLMLNLKYNIRKVINQIGIQKSKFENKEGLYGANKCEK